MTSSLTVVAIIAAYNEEDVIGEVVNALIQEDVQIYFLDHHSTDGTRAAVEAFLGRGVIGIEQFPADRKTDPAADAFAWERILKRKEELGRELSAEWFIHHDADEFRESPWSGLTLRDAIARVDLAGYNAIDFQLLNFYPTAADPREGDIRTRLQYFEPGRTFDNQQIKCWKKTGAVVDLASSGGHSAEFSERRVFPIRFPLRHYPIRSQAHGERKIFDERVPRFTPEERARGWHVQYDEWSPGASFVRDPATLTRYDPDRVRLDISLRHRDIERLEQSVTASEAEVAHLTSANAELRDHLAAQDAEMDRIRSERQRLLSELDTLQTHLRKQDDEIDTLRQRVRDTEAAIEAIMASRSWRLTAPLRSAERLVRRRSSHET